MTASTRIPEITSWPDIAWAEVEARVHALQRRIYRAEQRGQRRKVKSLQRLLLRSTSAKLLAVRRVTQDNQGKKTPGIDGIASPEPEERCLLVRDLDSLVAELVSRDMAFERLDETDPRRVVVTDPHGNRITVGELPS